ncbi:MAG: hypothetical protein D6706_17670 [Chloroflexi bacterium]|nr:MAG: hypothetical protein D6706_17670 [Chloroflexota bacterium]
MNEDVLDLYKYLKLLFSKWKVILGGTILAAITAFIVSYLLPPTYEATALVVITNTGERVQFDPRFQDIINEQSLSAYPELANSDEILQELLVQLEPPPTDVDTIDTLKNMVSASAGGDPSLIRLTVKSSNPAEAARIANLWAELFVAKINELFNNPGDTQVQAFTVQLEAAQQNLEESEQALIDFQAHNKISILQNQLQVLLSTQADYLAQQQEIFVLLQDIENLRSLLEQGKEQDIVSFADQITALLLQIRAFDNKQANEGDTFPLQLQLTSAEELTVSNRNEQVAYLDSLARTLQARQAQVEQRLNELEPQILLLQQQKQAATAEFSQLTNERDIAQETYTALARKVEEAKIEAQGIESTVRVGSKAVVPTKPVAPRVMVNTVLAGIVGLFTSIGIVFAVEFWMEVREEEGSTLVSLKPVEETS